MESTVLESGLLTSCSVYRGCIVRVFCVYRACMERVHDKHDIKKISVSLIVDRGSCFSHIALHDRKHDRNYNKNIE